MAKKNLNNIENPHPLSHANIFSKSSFWWLKDIISYGSKHDLKPDDLYNILVEDKSELLADNLEKAWLKECEYARESKKRPSLPKCLVKLYGKECFKYAILLIILTIFLMTQPLTIGMILSYFDNPPKISIMQACIVATLSVFQLILGMIFRRYGCFLVYYLGMRVKIACSTLIYRKLLRLSIISLKSNSASKSMINLLTNDIIRFEVMCLYLPFLVIIPMQTGFMFYLISKYINIVTACLAIGLLILQCLPIQVIYYKATACLRMKQTAATDKRISLISEILSAIRIIKMYAWEQYFENSVLLLRKNEVKEFLKMSYVSSVSSSAIHFAHRWCLFSLTLMYIFQNNVLTSTQIILAMQYLSALRENMTLVLSECIKAIADTANMVTRIEDFLVQEEIKLKVNPNLNVGHDKSIKLKGVTASWGSANSYDVLKDVTLEVDHGKLFVVIGPVGCGKSTLLKLILGEVTPKTGDILVNGRVSYASQEPWLFNGSIQDNILFGKEYDECKYMQVVTSCALLEDFTQLPYGDKTLVGERGMSLSGGQCARVNLARAVYRDADLYLLDDPLSSVDSRVAKKLFDDCFDGLLKNKTRILVSHNRMYLNRAYSVIAISNGKIQYQGPITDFESDELKLRRLSLSGIVKKVKKRNNFTTIDCLSDAGEMLAENENRKNEPKETDELLTERSRSKWLIWDYIKASRSFLLFCFCILINISVILACVAFDYLIVTSTQSQKKLFENTNESESNGINNTHFDVSKSQAINDRTSFFTLLGSLVIVITITAVLKNLVLFKFMYNANTNIHNSMFAALIKTPLNFFKTNPSGKIMNSFTVDVGVADDQLARCVFVGNNAFIETSAYLLSILIIHWWHFISIIVLGFLVFKTYNLCAPVLRSTMRLAANAKSPILSLAIATEVGKATIRSSQAEGVVKKIFHSHQDKLTAAHSVWIACFFGFALWLDLVTALLYIFVIFTSFTLKSSGASSSYIGLILMQISNLSVFFSVTVRLLFFETTAYLVNIGRMFQITKVEQEECLNDLTIKVCKSWPTRGEIKFVDLYLKYSDDDQPILKNLNITIESQSKVGVVGRTGAGKSSLVSALFRLARIDGTILIDDIDIKRISLKELRSKISIIPQEPILFNTSLRTNLDPFNEFDDAKLWAAVECVELKNVFPSLDHMIEVGGCNLSLGQRQLVCLARAVVRNNKILVLDEATANVDSETDALIQKTLRAEFSNCTVITIAHRLNTVMDSDKILVMDNGQVREYDHPDVLLKNRNGYFYKVVQQMNAAAERSDESEDNPSP